MIKSKQVTLNGKLLNLPQSKQGKGHYLEILEVIVDQIDAMQSHHSRVLVLRVDLHLHEWTASNSVVSELISRFRKKLARRDIKRLGYIWCREQDGSDAQHYHFAFLIDGNKHRHPKRLIEEIQCIWDERQIGFTYVPKRCYTLLKRGDYVTYQKTFDRLSYLAKVATKSKRKATTNDYSASRIKHREIKIS